MFEKVMCPNKDCTWDEKLKEGEVCPVCGTQAETLSSHDHTALGKVKRSVAKEGKKTPLLAPAMSDQDVMKGIFGDIDNLARHEAGTAWMNAVSLLSFNSTQQMIGAGFKMLVDQNKILIRQNELILRALKERR